MNGNETRDEAATHSFTYVDFYVVSLTTSRIEILFGELEYIKPRLRALDVYGRGEENAAQIHHEASAGTFTGTRVVIKLLTKIY